MYECVREAVKEVFGDELTHDSVPNTPANGTQTARHTHKQRVSSTSHIQRQTGVRIMDEWTRDS